jgi:signal transduction histidine kinase
VSQDQLGLFDTRPDRQEIRFSLVIVSLLVVAVPIILALGRIRLRQIDAFVPVVDSVMLMSDLMIATMLYAQASVFRSRALTVLASGYVFTGLVLIPHALTFPGAFAPTGLLGAGINTTGWIFMFRRAAFPIAVILYVYLKRADLSAQLGPERPAARLFVGLFTAVALTAAMTIMVTSGQDLLPPLFVNQRDAIFTNLFKANAVLILLTGTALGLLFWQRKSLLDLWLLVALSGWFLQLLVNLPPQSRFSLSFYCQFGMQLASILVVMLALIADSNRLYARLALSTAARNRERETRLMSMDAVAAAISHEVGQPLSAVTLNASAGLNWLTRTPPSPEKAIQSLRAAVDDARRTFDVIKSVRATFAKEPGTATEFSLNDLARETAALLGRELAGHKVSLELSLDEALPPIFGNRIQIQRVLINLLSNAIESLNAIRSRPRRIAIRSLPLDGKNVLLDISDTGAGIGPETMEHIFEAFFTTKSTGTGLGLSLCRTIVEEHGGSLWASPGEKHGATFHLQLPRSGTPDETAIR